MMGKKTPGRTTAPQTWLLTGAGLLIALSLACSGATGTTATPATRAPEATSAQTAANGEASTPETNPATGLEATSEPETPEPRKPRQQPTEESPAEKPEPQGAKATPEPEPEATPESEPEATPEPERGPDEEQTDGPARPDDPERTMNLIQALPRTERDCLSEEVKNGWVELKLSSVMSARHAQALREATECLSDESVVSLMIIPEFEDQASLSDQDRNCLRAGNSGNLVRTALRNIDDYTVLTDSLFIAGVGIMLNTASCLGEQRLEETGMSQHNQKLLSCIIQTPEEALETINAVAAGDQEKLAELEERSATCAQQFPPEPLPEPFAECTKEDREAGYLCREE